MRLKSLLAPATAAKAPWPSLGRLTALKADPAGATVGERMRTSSPLGVLGEAMDQAYLLLYLASDASRFVTGQIFRANGGQSITW